MKVLDQGKDSIKSPVEKNLFIDGYDSQLIFVCRGRRSSRHMDILYVPNMLNSWTHDLIKKSSWKSGVHWDSVKIHKLFQIKISGIST